MLVAYVTMTVSAFWVGALTCWHLPAGIPPCETAFTAVLMVACCPQAFGNNAAQLVVLSIKPVTSWTVTAAEIML